MRIGAIVAGWPGGRGGGVAGVARGRRDREVGRPGAEATAAAWQDHGVDTAPPTPARPAPAAPLHRAALRELDPLTAYRILALRSAVFVVEQACPYQDLDGRDLEPGAVQLWAEAPDGEVLATLRELPEPDGVTRIGRVCVQPARRGAGLAAAMMADSVTAHGHGVIVLEAQAHLAGWYARFGFRNSGERYLEDGIPHQPMRRPAGHA